MNETRQGFLGVASEAASAEGLLRAEGAWGRRARFAALDDLLGHALQRSLEQRQRVILLPTRDTDRLALPQWKGLGAKRRASLDDHFSVAAQRARGAWYLPEAGAVHAGYINLPFHFSASERFPMTLVQEDKGRADFDASPEAVLLWSLLGPLFDALFLPFALRGPDAAEGKVVKAPEEAAAVWEGIVSLQAELGFALADAMGPLLPGAGWERLRAGEQIAVKRRLLDAMAEQVAPETGARWRAHVTRELVEQYRKKSKGGAAPAKRQTVVTRAFQRHLTGCFGGDWLALLDYLDASPHPDERIVTALPEARLYVRGDEAKVARVAAEQGLPVEDVRQILGTLWQGQRVSPVEERAKVLQRFWVEFDAVHERQAPGMRPLWGLVADTRLVNLGRVLGDGGPSPEDEEEDEDDFDPYQSGIYRELLTADLCADIDRLWGGRLLPAYPDRIVTELSPHATMADAFGPALAFWQGCALTAWFLCEGPYSRTDMKGLREYHKKHLAALEELGAPVDPRLFQELIAGERRLGKPKPTRRREVRTEDEDGFAYTTVFESGMRRSGYERLRDAITRHRRAWAGQHLLPYLQKRWESDLREAGRRYHIHLNEKGKPPTAKQFAAVGGDAANRWFGGDLAALAAALGERSPVSPERALRLLSSDLHALGVAVYHALGGTPLPPMPKETEGKAARRQWDEALQRHRSLVSIAELAPAALQLQEALGAAPTLPQFGAGRFAHLAPALDEDADAAWAVFLRALEAARAGGRSSAGQTPLPAAGQDGRDPRAAPAAARPPAAAVPTQAQAQVQPAAPAAEVDMSPRPAGRGPERASSPPATHEPVPQPAEAPRKRSLFDRLFRRR